MRKGKRRILEAVLEILAELLLTVLFLGLGFLIIRLFGVEAELENMDPDLIVLIGVAPFLVLFAVYVCVKLIKGKKKDK
jgi:hypothetical protein